MVSSDLKELSLFDDVRERYIIIYIIDFCGNILATQNQQAIINDVIEVKSDV